MTVVCTHTHVSFLLKQPPTKFLVEQGGLCDSCLAKEQLFDFKALTLVSMYVVMYWVHTQKLGFGSAVTKLPFFKVSKSKVLELKEVRCILDLNIIKKAKCLERMNKCLV